MDVQRHPDYPSFSLIMEENRYPINPPDDHLNGYHQRELYASRLHANDGQTAVDTPAPNDGDQSPLEDAQLILGRNVTFTIIADDDAFDAQEVVEGLANAHMNGIGPVTTLTIRVPRNKVTSFNEALRECLSRRSRQVVERAGQTSFWKGREPFMRPTLSRSLSLP